MAVQISGNDITVPRDGSFTRNVTIGGTLTYEDVTNIDSVGLVTARNGIEIGARPGVAASISVDGNMIISGISTFGDDVTFTGASYNVLWDKSDNQLEFGDNAKISFGASSDLQLYHDSNDSIISNANGDLYINNTGGSSDDVHIQAADDILLRPQGGENGIKVIGDGAVELYHDNSKKFETASYGVLSAGQVRVSSSNATTPAFSVGDSGTGFYNTGSNMIGYSANGTQKWNINSSGDLILQDSVKIKFGTSSDSEIYHDTADTYFKNSTGTLYFRSDTVSLNALSTTDTYLSCTNGGAVSLRHDNSEKLVTTSTGITVTGSVSVTTEPAFRAGLINASTAVSHNNNYTIPFDTDSGDGCFDTNGCFNTSNHRFTPNLAGYYYLHFQVRCDLGGADHLFQARIKHSSGNYIVINEIFNKSGDNNGSNSASCIQYFNGSSDYVTAEFYQNSGYTINIYGGTTYHYQTFFEGHFVRSA